MLLITTILLKWNSKKGKKLLYYLTPVLLLGDLMLGKYSLFLWHREFPYVVVRNWLFVGVPYFAIGMWISDHASSVRGKVTKRCAMVLMVVFSIMGIMERITLERFGLNASRDHYASTTFLAVTVFLFFLYYVARVENFMSRIGRNDSTWVYIIHPLIISFLDAAIARTGVHGKIVYLYIRPFMVFIISIFIVEVTRRFILKRKGTVI